MSSAGKADTSIIERKFHTSRPDDENGRCSASRQLVTRNVFSPPTAEFTISFSFAVIALAGSQLKGMYDDVNYELTHITDAATVAPNGTTLIPGATPMPGSCPPGDTVQLRGHKWKCK